MQSSARWWEFYFVRYAIGTLVGALVVNQAFRIHPSFREFMLFGLVDGANPVPKTVLVLGYGLLFCYIASIPILVLHAARFAISLPVGIKMDAKNGLTASGRAGRFRALICQLKISVYDWHSIRPAICAALICMFSILIIAAYQALTDVALSRDALMQVVITVALLVIWMEWAAVIILFCYGDKAYAGMKSLARARNNNANRGELIDSYRHLREHGNSILIVVLELVLGAAFLGAISLLSRQADFIAEFSRGFLPFLFLWMLPGSFVWFSATLVERRFSLDPDYMQDVGSNLKQKT